MSELPDDEIAFMEDCQLVHERCLAAGTHISAERIQSFLPEGRKTLELVAKIINHLASQGLLTPSHDENGQVVCKAESKDEAARMKDMDDDERMVYSCIKSAGTAGIWIKYLRIDTNLSGTVIRRVIKTLKSKSYIKRVKSHQYPTRMMYMLYDLTPTIETSGEAEDTEDTNLTLNIETSGDAADTEESDLKPSHETSSGPWYTEDSEFDADFVNSLSSALEKFIASKSWPQSQDIESIYLPSYSGYPTAQDAHEWLSGRGVTDVKLSIADIVALLDVLIYDGKIEKRGDGLTYKSVKPLVDKDGPHALTDMPCGLCPVFDVCEEGGAVSPEGCPYWQEWLEREQ